MIYHIAHNEDWNTALKNNSYKPASLATEGFIHCSPEEKIIEAADNFYKGREDLLLLSIDETKVEAKIIMEDLYNHNFEFPHIYGELNLNAVVKITNFKCNEDGKFQLPEDKKD